MAGQYSDKEINQILREAKLKLLIKERKTQVNNNSYKLTLGVYREIIFDAEAFILNENMTKEEKLEIINNQLQIFTDSEEYEKCSNLIKIKFVLVGTLELSKLKIINI